MKLLDAPVSSVASRHVQPYLPSNPSVLNFNGGGYRVLPARFVSDGLRLSWGLNPFPGCGWRQHSTVRISTTSVPTQVLPVVPTITAELPRFSAVRASISNINSAIRRGHRINYCGIRGPGCRLVGRCIVSLERKRVLRLGRC